ncbi:adenosylhomocysteinase [Candidatus Undinarchaeota archaeon]
MPYDIRNKSEHVEGKKRIEWARTHMPVLESIGERFQKEKPFKGLTVGMCLHVEPKTCVLALTFARGGAKVAITGCNPLSTQDSAAASLAIDYGLNVYTWYNETEKEYYQNINKVLDHKPDIVIDDGCDLIFHLHKKRKELLPKIIGGCEETTTGIHRLAVMAQDKVLKFPVVNINDAQTKHFFDNRYGTGQSTLEGIMTATNTILAGKTIVIAGYGWCGRGAAMRAQGMGCNVIVTEIDPVKSIEAKMDGFRVMPMDKAAKEGDIFLTATGNVNVITKRHFPKMKDGAILSNTGHFDVEINEPELKTLSKSVKNVRKNVDEYKLKNGNRIYLLAQGRLVNLACAQGHAMEVMDMSFANQALSAEFLVKSKKLGLVPGLYSVPPQIDNQIAELWLKSQNVKIDSLSKEQTEYMSSWDIGT